jgi:hypothetical protein
MGAILEGHYIKFAILREEEIVQPGTSTTFIAMDEIPVVSAYELPPEPPKPKHVNPFYVGLIFAVALVGGVGTFAWFGTKWGSELDEASRPVEIATLPQVRRQLIETVEAAGIGAEIFDVSAAPLDDAIPDTAPPVTNPVDALYRNPFE